MLRADRKTMHVRHEGNEFRLESPERQICPHHDHELEWDTGAEGVELELVLKDSPFPIARSAPGQPLRIRRLKNLPAGKSYPYEIIVWRSGVVISTIGGLLSTYNGKGVEKPVQITLVNDIPTVDYDPVKVDRCKGDWVNWTCPEADRFEVEFTVKSPFSGKKYGGPKTAKSDKCKADADVGGHKYLIRVWKGGKLYEVDPIADVEDGGDE